ncbi:MAG: hypothetical protein JWL81_32, partial [Verrucomicrobiales bacterium]|nr:hypothetical protein [Verrucomicrobiales bacterium]
MIVPLSGLDAGMRNTLVWNLPEKWQDAECHGKFADITTLCHDIVSYYQKSVCGFIATLKTLLTGISFRWWAAVALNFFINLLAVIMRSMNLRLRTLPLLAFTPLACLIAGGHLLTGTASAAPPLINPAATAGLFAVSDTSPINLTDAAGVSPTGGTFSGNGVAGDTFDPALASPGPNTITYTVAAESVSFTITTTAAPTVPAVPTNALTTTLKSSIVLSDNGLATGVGGSEIPAFDPASKRAFAASNAGVQVVDLTNPSAPVKLAPIDPTADGLGTKDVSHV